MIRPGRRIVVAMSGGVDSSVTAALLKAAAELSGGWQRGPYQAADGTKRARGCAIDTRLLIGLNLL